MPHIQVSDVSASVARALDLGGSELMHGKSEQGQSQWAVLLDPMGAAFGLIPVVSGEAATASGPEGVGRIAWLTLAVQDVPSTCRFYEQVVGWAAEPAEVDGVFEMRRPDGVASAEIGTAEGDHEGVPPVWIVRLPVGDLGGEPATGS